MHTRIHTHAHTHMHAQAHIRTHTHTRTQTHAHTHTHTHAHNSSLYFKNTPCAHIPPKNATTNALEGGGQSLASLPRGFFHEAYEALAVELGVHAAELALDPADALVPRLEVLQLGIHLQKENIEFDGWVVLSGLPTNQADCHVHMQARAAVGK